MSRVYFIRPIGMDGPVKIGLSAEPIKRLKQLMVWSPFPLEIAAAFPGNGEDEAAVQGMFSAFRSHGEWFAPNPGLLTFIENIQNGVAVDKASPEYRTAKSGMRVASGVKSHLTKRVNTAEKACARCGVSVIRPDHIRQALAEYTGPDKPVPTAEHRALIDLYVRELAVLRSGIAA